MVFQQLTYFYKYLGYRLGILIILGIIVGILDGIGISVFLPLLELITNNNEQVTINLTGNFPKISEALENIGFQLNLTNSLILIILVFSSKSLFDYGEGYFKIKTRRFFIKKIKLNAIDILSKMSYSKFTSLDNGELTNILTEEVQKINNAFNTILLSLKNGLIVLTFLLMAIYTNLKFSLFIISGIILSNLLFRKIFKTTKFISKTRVNSKNHYHKFLNEGIQNFKYLKATKTLNNFLIRVKGKIIEIENQTFRSDFLSNIISSSKEPLILIILCLTLFFYFVIFQGTSEGVILNILFFYRSLNYLNNFQVSFNNYLSYSGSLFAFNKFIDNLKEYSEKYQPNVIPPNKENLIKLVNVSFGYSNSSPILKGINLTIKKNEILGIVGQTGSGKTTLVNILSGLIQPSSGLIFQQQHRIGYITQEPVVFDDSFFNNITLWDKKDENTIRKFRAALKDSLLLDFVDKLPLKEDTKLGNNGITLSGGQKQRVSIARELYRNIDILVSDEATSSLDSETEKLINENFEKLTGTITQVIISHRLSTLKKADRILFIRDGKIFAEGNFEYLKSNIPIFRNLVEIQKMV